MAIDEPERAGLVLVENKILTQQAEGPDVLFLEFRHGRNGHPVAAQQFAHRGARPHSSQEFIVLIRQHP